ncbi:MAG: serine/threonine-protein kinase [Pseudomonadota bacterium]
MSIDEPDRRKPPEAGTDVPQSGAPSDGADAGDEDDGDRTVIFSPQELAAAQAAAEGQGEDAGPAAPEDDGDRTILFSPDEVAAAQPEASPEPPAEPESAPAAEDDGDRTVIFSPEEVDAARTAAPTDAPAEEDNDRTVVFTAADIAAAQGAAGQGAAPVSDDDGFGIPAAAAAAPAAAAVATPAAADEDDDRTRIAPATATPATPTAVEDDDDRTIVTTTAGVSAAGVQATTPTFTENQGFAPPPGTPDATPLSSLEPGTVINNMYRVEERLDQGGMGRVFRGVEIGTGEAVAIKVILPEMAEDDKVTQMFRREARTLRQLHHDAIVRYFAYVPPDARMNLHALVMGFIQGTKLSDRLVETGGLTQRQVVRLTTRLADGLERAHQIGVVHRDLSPDNVMLPDGDLGKAVIIDFGISRSSAVKEGTIGNEFAGKLKYVSPEQLGLFGGDAEAPSDVYSLGLLMMAMITGQPVPMGNSIADAVQKRQTLPDLKDIPLEFRDVLTKMLQPDPADRMPSMQAVIDHLSEFDGAITGLNSRRGTRAPVVDRAVPGLQALPSAARANVTEAPTDTTAQTELAAHAKQRGGFGFIAAIALVAALAGGGFVLFGDQMEQMLNPDEEEALTGEEAVAAGLAREEGSRAAFLAGAVPDECSFASRRAEGASAGVIEGFGAQVAGLRGVGADFGAQYGISPEVVTRSIPETHCAVLDFARAFQGTAGAPIEVTLAANVMSRTTGVVGAVHNSDGRANFLALVDPTGRMFSLMRQLDDPVGQQRRFSFRLPSATLGVYLLVVTASDSPLVRAGAMQDGALASEFLPLLTRELAVDGAGAVDIGYLELTR